MSTATTGPNMWCFPRCATRSRAVSLTCSYSITLTFLITDYEIILLALCAIISLQNRFSV